MKITIEVELPEVCNEETCRFCLASEHRCDEARCSLFNVEMDDGTTTPCPQCIAARKEAGRVRCQQCQRVYSATDSDCPECGSKLRDTMDARKEAGK